MHILVMVVIIMYLNYGNYLNDIPEGYIDKSKELWVNSCGMYKLLTKKKMLESTDYTISEISSIVGYDNPLYFSRLFHKHVGMSPRKYRSIGSV